MVKLSTETKKKETKSNVQEKKDEKKENGKKGLFAKMMDSIDEKMEKKSKTCCCEKSGKGGCK